MTLPVCSVCRNKGVELDLQLLIKEVCEDRIMKNFTAIVERDTQTNLYVGYVPGFPGAHSQGKTLDELQAHLREVIEMLLEDVETDCQRY
jgi:predicted RNase H-like HicB family nuclease